MPKLITKQANTTLPSSRIGKTYLTERQAQFCRNYAEITSDTFQNANESAKKAGYNNRISAYELVRLPHIKERIEQIESLIGSTVDWTKEVFNYEVVKCYREVPATCANKPKYLEMIGKVKGFLDPAVSNTFIFANMDKVSILQRVKDISAKLSNGIGLGKIGIEGRSGGIVTHTHDYNNSTPPPEISNNMTPPTQFDNSTNPAQAPAPTHTINHTISHTDTPTPTKLQWTESIGYGFYPVEAPTYDEAYFDKYLGYETTELGANINRFRKRIVKQFCGAAASVLDIGVGSGAFIKARKLISNRITMGYDVCQKAVDWLKENNLYYDPYLDESRRFTGLSFFDSLEHIEKPEVIINKVNPKVIFVTLPIFRDQDHALSSKHFRPSEHYHYFTKQGFIQYMEKLGYVPVFTSKKESELGREDILTFVFKKTASVCV